MLLCIAYRSVLLACTLGSILIIARHFTPSSDSYALKAVVTVHLDNSRKPLSVMDMSEPQPAATMIQTKRCAR